MRLPRDVSGRDLARMLARVGYATTRQSGSHMRLTTTLGGEHHVTIPDHDALRVGTLAAILDDVASHMGRSREDLLAELLGP
jgi:predicted RNA binding protein YcfA (HicA-like mRNA interferase family)